MGEVQDGQRTHGEVRDGSWDPRGGPGQVGGASRRCETGQETLEEVWNGWETLGEVREGRGTHPEVRDGSEDPQGGLRWVGDPP